MASQDTMFKLSDISISAPVPVQKLASRSLLLLPAGDLDTPADCATVPTTAASTTAASTTAAPTAVTSTAAAAAPATTGRTVAGVAVAAAAAAAAFATVRV